MKQIEAKFDKKAKDVLADTLGLGGGFTTVKAGQKIRIDLSKYTQYIYEDDNMDFHNTPMRVFDCLLVPELPTGPIIDTDYISFVNNGKGAYMLSMIINTAHTQLLCVCGYSSGNNEYTSLMPVTVVYKSDTPISYNDGQIPAEVLASLPTIEMVVTEDLVGNLLRPSDIPFELVD